MKTQILEIFNTQLNNFLNELITCFPNSKKQIEDIVPVDLKNEEYIKLLYGKLKDSGNKLKDKNIEILKNLFSFIDIHDIINNDSSDKDKHSIWNYISCFYLYSVIYYSESDIFNLISSFKDDDAFTEILQNLVKINKDIPPAKTTSAETTSAETTSAETTSADIKDSMDEMFNNNKLLSGEIGNLTKDIINDLNIEKLMSEVDPVSLLKSLMSPGKMDLDNPITKLVSDIGGKIKSKIDSGSLDEQKLVQEASNISGDMTGDDNNIGNIFNNIMNQNGASTDDQMPDIGNILQNMMPMVQNMFKGMEGQQQQGLPQMDLSSIFGESGLGNTTGTGTTGTGTTDKTRNRLRKKLQDRENKN